MNTDLKNLSFGVPAAERDEDLHACFVSSDTYTGLESGKKTIILGNRGAGKSALFRQLGERAKAKGHVVITLAPEDYAYELLAEALKREAEGAWAKHGAYAAAWKYLIYVTNMKHVTGEGAHFKKGDEAKIYTYLRDKHAGTETNPIGTMVSFLKRLEGLKVGTFEAGFKVRELKRLYGLEELAEFLPMIDNACASHNAVVLVDELDKGWDASEDAVAFVAGLFQAAVSINSQMRHVRVYVSLRKELYDNIPALYEDAQKVRDIIETVQWDEPALLELIGRRISRCLPGLDGIPYQDRWNHLFAEVLDYRQTKSFNYIVDRTLYRPREIIQFCNDIAEQTRQRRPGAHLPFDYQQIAVAEYAYSEARLKDICSEYRFQYPGLQSILETFRGASFNFDRGPLLDHLIGVIVGETPIAPEAKKWCQEMEPEGLIQALWTVGFLRVQAVGGIKARRRSGSSYLGSHQITSLNLSGLSRFHVHPMFRSYLGMKEGKEGHGRADLGE